MRILIWAVFGVVSCLFPAVRWLLVRRAADLIFPVRLIQAGNRFSMRERGF